MSWRAGDVQCAFGHGARTERRADLPLPSSTPAPMASDSAVTDLERGRQNTTRQPNDGISGSDPADDWVIFGRFDAGSYSSFVW
jgi:hypothetical protein